MALLLWNQIMHTNNWKAKQTFSELSLHRYSSVHWYSQIIRRSCCWFLCLPAAATTAAHDTAKENLMILFWFGNASIIDGHLLLQTFVHWSSWCCRFECAIQAELCCCCCCCSCWWWWSSYSNCSINLRLYGSQPMLIINALKQWRRRKLKCITASTKLLFPWWWFYFDVLFF